MRGGGRKTIRGMSERTGELWISSPGVGRRISGCHSLGCKYGCWVEKKKKGGRVGVGSVDDGNAAAAGSASTVPLHSLAMLLA